MQSAIVNTIPMRGDLCIVVRDATTRAVRWRYEIRNTITYNALAALVNLISQKTTVTASDYKVAYLRVGLGTTAPTRSDLDLEDAAVEPPAVIPFTIALGDANKVLTISNPFEMKIVATLETTDLNGQSLTEAGLFTYGTTTPTPPGSPAQYSGRYPELFARQIHPAISKTNAFVVDYEWRISFTA